MFTNLQTVKTKHQIIAWIKIDHPSTSSPNSL